MRDEVNVKIYYPYAETEIINREFQRKKLQRAGSSELDVIKDYEMGCYLVNEMRAENEYEQYGREVELLKES